MPYIQHHALWEKLGNQCNLDHPWWEGDKKGATRPSSLGGTLRVLVEASPFKDHKNHHANSHMGPS
jgi:hypothetical protein